MIGSAGRHADGSAQCGLGEFAQPMFLQIQRQLGRFEQFGQSSTESTSGVMLTDSQILVETGMSPENNPCFQLLFLFLCSLVFDGREGLFRVGLDTIFVS